MTNILSEKKSFYRVVYLLVILFVIFLVTNAFAQSLFITKKDRVNLVIYGQEPQYYSFSESDTVDYTAIFDEETKISVPGGYGQYRFGALGWLVSDQKKPQIFQKAFSTATSSIVDFYFYKGGDMIFHKDSNIKEVVTAPNIYKILFYRSNASIFDRLYLFLRLVSGNRNTLSKLDYKDKERFLKNYQGYLYQKTYRNDNKNVQIVYSKSYNTAVNMANILTGNGINVVDISGQENSNSSFCIILEDSPKLSQTAKDIARFLNCKLERKNTKVFDIIILLGKKEADWEVD